MVSEEPMDRPRGAPPTAASDADATPWFTRGIAAGVLGAFTVALFLLITDALQGRAFWTPAALGSALFQGEPLAVGARFPAVLVAGYTAVHGAVFIGLGVIAAFLLTLVEVRPSGGPTLLTAVALFLCFEAVFLGFAALFVPGLVAELGAGLIAAANLLSAGAMAGFLLRGKRS